MIATEPIDDATWDEIGLARREVFEFMAPMVAYGQRTADGRIAMGGLGAPVPLAARGIPDSPMTADRTAARLRALLGQMFPVLARRAASPTTGAASSASTRRHPSERRARPGHRPGLGRRLRRLGCRRRPTPPAGPSPTSSSASTPTSSGCRGSDHRSPVWEPEPLRWLGVNSRKLTARAMARAEQHRVRRQRSGATS